MRVIAGTAGGRIIRAAPGSRPTTDRVREALFSSLESLDVLAGARVFDLFCGSGALGIEALSRGVASAVFVDRDPRAVEVVRTNLSATGVEGEVELVVGDVLGWLRRAPGRCDLAFCDPPYAFDAWDELLPVLETGIVVAESGRDLEPPAGWEVLRQRRYGGTVVTMLHESRAGAARGPAEEE